MDEINLKQIIREFPDCITNGAKLKAVLLDTYPKISKAIVNTLVIMVNSGIAQEIQDSENITEFDKSRWQKKLEDDYGLSINNINNGIVLLNGGFISTAKVNSDSQEKKYYCPECGNEINDFAQDCPNCGCPNEYFDKSLTYKRKEYMYCSVIYLDAVNYKNPKQYYYISDDKNVKVGDHAIVTVGQSNDEKEVIVKKVETYSDNYPFPPEITKRIVSKL